MTRLAAQEKLQYYPTPPPIVEALLRYLSAPSYGTVRLLDPCSGTGAALAGVAGELRARYERGPKYSGTRLVLETYGIEPERQRAALATRALDQVLNTSFFSTMLSQGTGPDGGWQLLFLNPPYDLDNEQRDACGKKTRLEVSFLDRGTKRLTPGGILVYIIPQYVLKYSAKILASEYEQIECRRFPDEEWTPDPSLPEARVALYQQFRQVVLFARRRRYPVPPDTTTLMRVERWASMGADMDPLPLSERDERIAVYSIPAAQESTLRLFVSGTFSPEGAATAVLSLAPKGGYKTGVWANKEELAARGLTPAGSQTGGAIGTPMAPLKNAHLAVLAAAGIANRAILEGKDGRCILVKGSVRKVPLLKQEEDEDAITTKLTDTFESALWATDLSTGTLIRVETGSGRASSSALPFTVEHERMTMSEFLDNFGEALSASVTKEHPPRYQRLAQVPWLLEGFSHLKRRPLGKQAEIIAANVCALLCKDERGKTLSRIAPVAEMATGKTFLSLATAYLGDRFVCGDAHHPRRGVLARHLFPVVVLCPPIMARKWKREAEMTIPGVRVLIVKRTAKPVTVKGKKKGGDDGEEEEEMLPRGTTSFDDLSDLRLFAPRARGEAYSAVGTLDAAVRQIREDLTTWKREYTQARRVKRTPPRKPAHMVIVTTSTAKLGKDWMPVYHRRMARNIDRETRKIKILRDADGSPLLSLSCPSCGHILVERKRMLTLEKNYEEQGGFLNRLGKLAKKQHLSVAEQDAYVPVSVYLTEKELTGKGDTRHKHACFFCGECLWQTIPSGSNSTFHPSYRAVSEHAEGASHEETRPVPIPGDLDRLPPRVTSTVSRRYPIGDYLLSHYKGVFGLLIADEMHEGGDGTALGFARERLASACGAMIGLTGTLSNGYSASLFRLYYLLNREVRQDFEREGESRWIDLYGKRQTTQKVYKEKTDLATGSTSDRRIGKPTTKEIPGFAPLGLRRVLPVSTFLELPDVTPKMPYKEYIHVVDMDEPLESTYEKFEEEATAELGRMLARGDKSGLSSWWNGMLTYPNMPYRGWTCVIKKTQYVFAEAPALSESHVYPKERELINLVQRSVQSGRRVLVYAENTGYYDIQPRVKALLEQHVPARGGGLLSVEILRSTTVETIDREAWLADRVSGGCQVLICNPKLVKVGLDLIEFPTIVYISIPTSTTDLRQSSRRSLRPGQTKPVEVHFLVYRTVEARLLRLMARKMQASLMVEGQLPGEGLVSFGTEEEEGETDMILSLARAVLSQMEGGKGKGSDQSEMEELEALFQENQRISSEKAQTLGGEETQMEEPIFEPILRETLAPLADTREEEEEDCLETAAAPLTVTIIHTSVTPTRDPWAELREKYTTKKKSAKKRSSKQTQRASVPSLWVVGTPTDEPVCDEGGPEEEELPTTILTQGALW